MEEYHIRLGDLRVSSDLAPAKLIASVREQLLKLRRSGFSPYRYTVEMEIVEGTVRPAKDLDNYSKPILDAVTKSRLLWRDDNQVEQSLVARRRDRRLPSSEVHLLIRRLPGQHRGVPSHFRARCAEAAAGTPNNYSQVGYHLARTLVGEVPLDLEEEDWLEQIDRLRDLLEADAADDIWGWFCDHLPKFMVLVPTRHKAKFLSGIMRAYDQGEIDA